MKKTILLALCIVFIAQVVQAENFIGVKFGKAQYIKEKDSIWEGSHIYEGNETYGVVLGNKKDGWITRLDIERFRTGVELTHAMPLAYDGVKIYQYPIIISLGRQVGWFYWLVGGGFIVNKAEFWKYDPYPFDAKMQNSPCAALTLGLQKDITKNTYGFIEGQYIYSKARVDVKGYNSFTEDVSSITAWAGLGYKF